MNRLLTALRRTILKHLTTFIALAILTFSGCADQGVEGNACYPNGTCNRYLICVGLHFDNVHMYRLYENDSICIKSRHLSIEGKSYETTTTITK